MKINNIYRIIAALVLAVGGCLLYTGAKESTPEYKVLMYSGIDDLRKLEQNLNDEAQDGWRLVTFKNVGPTKSAVGETVIQMAILEKK